MNGLFVDPLVWLFGGSLLFVCWFILFTHELVHVYVDWLFHFSACFMSILSYVCLSVGLFIKFDMLCFLQEKMKGKNKLVPRLLGVTKESILRVDEKTKEVCIHTMTCNVGIYTIMLIPVYVEPWSQGWLIAAGAYPGFCSMKRLEVFLLPLDEMLVHRRSLPRNFVRFLQQIAGTHLYTWVERGTVRVKCLAQEHNTLSPARDRTRTARSGVERTNHEATAPTTYYQFAAFLFPVTLFLKIL